MQNCNYSRTATGVLTRDGELELRQGCPGGVGVSKKNGASKPEAGIPNKKRGQRKMLVSLDVACLIVGKELLPFLYDFNHHVFFLAWRLEKYVSYTELFSRIQTCCYVSNSFHFWSVWCGLVYSIGF